MRDGLSRRSRSKGEGNEEWESESEEGGESEKGCDAIVDVAEGIM